MQKKIVRTPIQIQLLFLLIIAVGAIGFLFSYQISGATTITRNYCDILFSESHFVELDRQYNKMCVNRWTFLTNQIKRSFINNNK